MGSYYPLIKNTKYVDKHDSETTAKPREHETAEDLFNNQERSSKISDQYGAAKERITAVYPVNLDLMTVGMGHLDNVIYMLSHYDAVSSANNIISNNKFRVDYQKVAGRHELSALDNWLQDIETPISLAKKSFIDLTMKHLRVGTVLALLGASIFKTAPKQMLGVFTAIDHVGIKVENETQKMAGIRGLGRLLSVFSSLAVNNKYRDDNIKFMLEHSAIMDDRINLGSFDKEVKEAKSQIRGGTGLKDKWNSVVMSPIVFVQSRMVDTPIWLASYENSINSRKGINITDDDIASAAAYADSIVELSQGSAGNKSLPWIIRSQRDEALRNILIFMTAMLNIFNGVAGDAQSVARGNKTPVEGFLGIAYKLMLPAVSITAINYLMSLGLDSDDEEFELAETYINEQRMAVFGILPFGGAINSAIDGFPVALAAMESAGKGISGISAITGKLGTDSEITDREIRNVAVALGTVLHVGGSNQIVKSVQGITQSFEEYDNEITGQMLYNSAYGATKK